MPDFPDATEFGKRIPRQKFYEHTGVPVSVCRIKVIPYHLVFLLEFALGFQLRTAYTLDNGKLVWHESAWPLWENFPLWKMERLMEKMNLAVATFAVAAFEGKWWGVLPGIIFVLTAIRVSKGI